MINITAHYTPSLSVCLPKLDTFRRRFIAINTPISSSDYTAVMTLCPPQRTVISSKSQRALSWGDDYGTH